MGTVFRRGGSPYYYTAFFDSHGNRRYRSTKRKRRSEAVKVAHEMEVSARRTGDDESSRRLLSILQDATERSLRGQMNVTLARDYLKQILECTSGERLYDPSIEEWLHGWLEDKRKSKSSGTSNRYSIVVEQFLDSLPDGRRRGSLSSLSIEDIRRFRDQLLDGGRTAVTTNCAVSILRIPLNVARRQGILIHNPADGVELLAKDQTKKDVFSPEQVRKLLAATSGDWKGLILAGYYTGARIGDLASLSWEAVDLELGSITLTQAKTKQTIVLPIHEQLKKWLLKTPKQSRKGPVFPSFPRPSPSQSTKLSRQFRQIMESAGIHGTVTEGRGEHGHCRRSLTFHSLRHSFNSAMANAGVPQEIRQRLTGHASKAINDRYTHAEFEVLQEAVGKVPALQSGDH